MASVKFYFDQRAKSKDGKYPLKVSVTNRQESTLINLEVRLTPEQWDNKKNVVVNHPNRLFINNYISKQKINIETELLTLKAAGKLSSLNGSQIKSELQKRLNSEPQNKEKKLLFIERFKHFINGKSNARTKENYLYTLSKIEDFTDTSTLSFEDIGNAWLKNFDLYLSKSSCINSRSIHMRNIRAVFNDALSDEIIMCYPFKKFKIKEEKTKKRSMSVVDLVKLKDYPTEEHQKQYRDFFMLIFYLIGINSIDLLHLTSNDLVNGRIEYRRCKTKRLYSIKLEPEASEIINRYRGEKYLLKPLDVYKNYKDYVHRVNENLQKIGKLTYEQKIIKGKKRNIKKYNGLFPELTIYWARHTWATIAASLDIPKDTIAAALGHGEDTVTDIYIDFDMKKVDEANRKILDYIKKYPK